LDPVTYTFDGQADASKYLREVGVLWGAWLVGLVGLLVTNAWLLLIWGFLSLAMLIVLARPIQRRAERLIPENKVVGGKIETVFRGGTSRDRAIRDLAYGTEPFLVALRVTGRSERWILVRHLLVALTILGLIWIILNPGI